MTRHAWISVIFATCLLDFAHRSQIVHGLTPNIQTTHMLEYDFFIALRPSQVNHFISTCKDLIIGHGYLF